MRYATLAFLSLLLLGMFGMAAPVMAEENPAPACVVTIDITGPAAISIQDDAFTVTADVGGTTGNYLYSLKIRLNEGQYVYSKSFVGSGPTISRIITTTQWGWWDDAEGAVLTISITIGTVIGSEDITVDP